MDNTYKDEPLQLVYDANEFANSRFGQHYLNRLVQAKEREMRMAMDARLTDSQRAHAASRAATVQAELDYFETAKTVRETPSLLNRLRRKLTGEEDIEPIV
ncbi:MAG: hypothetical protein LC803_09370 [Acidobacteria bacterium]|nr:hypothetical protein [Acidobacteriota bacterium]